MRGMHDCEFKKYLSRKSYKNLGDVLHKENEYIMGDEMIRISNSTAPTIYNSTYSSFITQTTTISNPRRVIIKTIRTTIKGGISKRRTEEILIRKKRSPRIF